MKSCPVCHKPITASLPYCTTCGADLSQPAKAQRERLLLVLTPFFLILLAVTISVEIGVIDAVDNGMGYGGGLAMLYLFAALLFWVLTKVFRLPALPDSFWQAGLVSVTSFIMSVLLAFLVSEVFADKTLMAVGPVKYHFAVLEILAVIFLPAFLAGLLAVSARARITRFSESAVSPFLKFLFKYALLLIPACITLLVVLIDLAQPAPARAMVRARVLYELQAADLALSVVDAALTADDNYASLHFIKGITILDYSSKQYDAADAVEQLEKANELTPNVPAWIYRLSTGYDRERNGAAAIAAATKATDLMPDDAFLWQYLGDLSMKYKKGPASVTAYKKALALTPDDPVLLNNLAFTMLELEIELPQALALARMSVELLPERAFNLDTLAWAYYKNAQYSEALEIMSAIFAGRSEVSPEIDFHYARILQTMNMLNNPLETFDKLLARPEVAADHHFFQQVYKARLEAEAATASAAAVLPEPLPGVGNAKDSPEEVKKDVAPADISPEQIGPDQSQASATEESQPPTTLSPGEPGDEQ